MSNPGTKAAQIVESISVLLLSDFQSPKPIIAGIRFKSCAKNERYVGEKRTLSSLCLCGLSRQIPLLRSWTPSVLKTTLQNVIFGLLNEDDSLPGLVALLSLQRFANNANRPALIGSSLPKCHAGRAEPTPARSWSQSIRWEPCGKRVPTNARESTL